MRATTSQIAGRRNRRASVILLTGVTGFVGSYIAASLLKDGCKLIFLCRGRNGIRAPERVARLLSWHGIQPDGQYEALEGDVKEPWLGLGQDGFRHLALKVDEIVHCAGYTGFEEAKRRELFETNVGGALRIMGLAEAGPCDSMHLLSTAYVAGKDNLVCREVLAPAGQFHNPYEASKHEAEIQVAERCRQAGIHLTLYRPSIVIGDSVLGRTLLFNAMYYPMKIAVYLADGFRRDFAEHGGELARRMGARLEPDGCLHLPVRIDAGPVDAGRINLVPIDFVVDSVRAIMRRVFDGGIFHIVNPRPVTICHLINAAQAFFRLGGFSAVPGESFEAVPKSALERRFDHFNRVYLPYMSDIRRFDNTLADRVLTGAGVVCPEIDYGVLSRCFAFAVECGWRSPQEEM